MGIKFSELYEIQKENVAANDYLAVLDTSANLLVRTTADHAVPTTAFGMGSTENYGHLKISDVYDRHVGGASTGVAASQDAVYCAFIEAVQTCLPSWIGTWDQWEALTVEEKNQYSIVNIIDR